MDIKLPLDANLQLAIGKAGGATLALKLDQVLEAKIITNQAILNTFTVGVGNKTLTLQSPKNLGFQPGETLRLQVVKLLPAPEFKILPPPTGSASAPSSTQPSLTLLAAPAPASFANNSNPLNTLSNGQPIQAIVVDIGKHTLTVELAATATGKGNLAAGATGSHVQLTLDNKQLLWPETSAKSALTVGSRIDLTPIKNGNSPVFNVASAVPSSEEQIAAALKQLLPQQNSSTLFLGQLATLLPELSADKTVGETLKQLALKILQNIPDKSRLFAPASLKQAISQSGLFMERNLTDLAGANPREINLQEDFKLKLSKLINQLGRELTVGEDDEQTLQETRELLKETMQKAQGNLARLTLDQLNSLPRDDTPKQVWVIELPFFNGNSPDTLELVVEQDKQADSESGQKNWVVTITITPPELATIHCKVSCYDGSVNTRFWSESAGTVGKINARLDYLRQQFEQKGLKPGFMDVQQGKPAQPSSQALASPNLLSEKV